MHFQIDLLIFQIEADIFIGYLITSRMRTIPLAKTSGAIEEADSEGNASTPALSKQVWIEVQIFLPKRATEKTSKIESK